MTSERSRRHRPSPRFHDLGSMPDPGPEDPHHAAYQRLDSAIYVAGQLPYVDGRAMRLADRLQAGMTGIDRGLVSDSSAPFGGVKQGGVGRGARASLPEFQKPQYLAVD